MNETTATPDPNAAPAAPAKDTPQGRAQAMTETMVNAGTVPSQFRDENGNVNQTYLFQTMLAMEKGEAPPAPTASEAVAPGTTPPAPAAADAVAAPTSDDTADTSLANALAAPKPPEGVNLWELASKQLRETGTVTPEVVVALKGQGATDEALAAMASGFKAKEATDTKAAYDLVGGKEAFDATIAWAKESLTPAELAGLDTGLKSEHSLLVLQGLHARAQAAPANGGQVVTGGDPAIAPNAGHALQAFAVPSEGLAAQRDPKYARDPVYRREVEARIMLSAGATHAQLQEMGMI